MTWSLRIHSIEMLRESAVARFRGARMHGRARIVAVASGWHMTYRDRALQHRTPGSPVSVPILVAVIGRRYAGRGIADRARAVLTADSLA